MINVLILNWNSANDIDCLLNSLKESNNKEFRVILINNGTDDWSKLLTLSIKYDKYFELHTINNNENLGYAEGNNSGLNYLVERKLSGDLLIINPDVILSRNSIDELIYARDLYENIGAVMIRTLDENNKVLYDSISLSGFEQKYIRVKDNQVTSTDYCAGSCILICRHAIDNLGLFDGRYFLYWEEVDLALRLRSKGYKLVTTTKSHIFRRSNSLERTSNAYYYFLRNSFLLKSKWPEKRMGFFHFLFIVKSIFSSLFNGLLNLNFDCLNNSLNGIHDGLKGRYGKRGD
ncbi:glycosyltransferase family 2 protein [Vibrio mimicus]|uniref:glycosyltransferase family 2 protein n=1 Tax=Vibrio mimicus TaxID=674 RepID=UPI0001BACE13|nr:glycosyltransferase [Vibrio mimicus]EEY46448.1 glycosyl transferase [Vibrio mimicus VM223]